MTLSINAFVPAIPLVNNNGMPSYLGMPGHVANVSSSQNLFNGTPGGELKKLDDAARKSTESASLVPQDDVTRTRQAMQSDHLQSGFCMADRSKEKILSALFKQHPDVEKAFYNNTKVARDAITNVAIGMAILRSHGGDPKKCEKFEATLRRLILKDKLQGDSCFIGWRSGNKYEDAQKLVAKLYAELQPNLDNIFDSVLHDEVVPEICRDIEQKFGPQSPETMQQIKEAYGFISRSAKECVDNVCATLRAYGVPTKNIAEANWAYHAAVAQRWRFTLLITEFTRQLEFLNEKSKPEPTVVSPEPKKAMDTAESEKAAGRDHGPSMNSPIFANYVYPCGHQSANTPPNIYISYGAQTEAGNVGSDNRTFYKAQPKTYVDFGTQTEAGDVMTEHRTRPNAQSKTYAHSGTQTEIGDDVLDNRALPYPPETAAQTKGSQDLEAFSGRDYHRQSPSNEAIENPQFLSDQLRLETLSTPNLEWDYFETGVASQHASESHGATLFAQDNSVSGDIAGPVSLAMMSIAASSAQALPQHETTGGVDARLSRKSSHKSLELMEVIEEESTSSASNASESASLRGDKLSPAPNLQNSVRGHYRETDLQNPFVFPSVQEGAANKRMTMSAQSTANPAEAFSNDAQSPTGRSVAVGGSDGVSALGTLSTLTSFSEQPLHNPQSNAEPLLQSNKPDPRQSSSVSNLSPKLSVMNDGGTNTASSDKAAQQEEPSAAVRNQRGAEDGAGATLARASSIGSMGATTAASEEAGASSAANAIRQSSFDAQASSLSLAGSDQRSISRGSVDSLNSLGRQKHYEVKLPRQISTGARPILIGPASSLVEQKNASAVVAGHNGTGADADATGSTFSLDNQQRAQAATMSDEDGASIVMRQTMVKDGESSPQLESQYQRHVSRGSATSVDSNGSPKRYGVKMSRQVSTTARPLLVGPASSLVEQEDMSYAISGHNDVHADADATEDTFSLSGRQEPERALTATTPEATSKLDASFAQRLEALLRNGRLPQQPENRHPKMSVRATANSLTGAGSAGLYEVTLPQQISTESRPLQVGPAYPTIEAKHHEDLPGAIADNHGAESGATLSRAGSPDGMRAATDIEEEVMMPRAALALQPQTISNDREALRPMERPYQRSSSLGSADSLDSRASQKRYEVKLPRQISTSARSLRVGPGSSSVEAEQQADPFVFVTAQTAAGADVDARKDTFPLSGNQESAQAGPVTYEEVMMPSAALTLRLQAFLNMTGKLPQLADQDAWMNVRDIVDSAADAARTAPYKVVLPRQISTESRPLQVGPAY